MFSGACEEGALIEFNHSDSRWEDFSELKLVDGRFRSWALSCGSSSVQCVMCTSVGIEGTGASRLLVCVHQLWARTELSVLVSHWRTLVMLNCGNLELLT